MTDSKKKALSFPLRLPRHIRAGLEARANYEGVSINQFIVIAVAEKLVHYEMQKRANEDCNQRAPR